MINSDYSIKNTLRKRSCIKPIEWLFCCPCGSTTTQRNSFTIKELRFFMLFFAQSLHDYCFFICFKRRFNSFYLYILGFLTITKPPNIMKKSILLLFAFIVYNNNFAQKLSTIDTLDVETFTISEYKKNYVKKPTVNVIVLED